MNSLTLSPQASPIVLQRGATHRPILSPVAGAVLARSKPTLRATPSSGASAAVSTIERPAPLKLEKDDAVKEQCLHDRHVNITQYFPTALGIDDFMARLEVALSGFGFTGENSIAMTCLCRDEVTIPLKDKIEAVFGSSFNTNGLGAVLTCGVTGMGAGLSHSPVSGGKEHYVFFAFPHIAINSRGEVGAISRPGRPAKSCACGALQKCLNELKAEGLAGSCKVPGVHDALDPEYSILKQRLARRARHEKVDPAALDLTAITKLAERTISDDLEYLVERAVDPTRANYAVVTGVQVHNWAADLGEAARPSGTAPRVPSLEFVAPARVFVVVDGVKTRIDLAKVPAMSPRQLQIMAQASISTAGRAGADSTTTDAMISRTSAGTLKEIPLKYLTQRLGVTRSSKELDEALRQQTGLASPAWQKGIIASAVPQGAERDLLAPTMDGKEGGKQDDAAAASAPAPQQLQQQEEKRFNPSFGSLFGMLTKIGSSSGSSNMPWPPSV